MNIFFLKGQFKIKHQQRKHHDDGISKNHGLVLSSYSIDQPYRDIKQQNQDHPNGKITN
jgi:hypothetical protein